MNEAPMYEDYEDCAWTPDTPDACPYCSGEACAKCGPYYFGRPDCNCDSLERHRQPDNRSSEELKEGLKRIRALSATKGVRAGKLVKPEREPRYDELYEQGVAWLGGLADQER